MSIPQITFLNSEPDPKLIHARKQWGYQIIVTAFLLGGGLELFQTLRVMQTA